jgi:hypothetical protein
MAGLSLDLLDEALGAAESLASDSSFDPFVVRHVLYVRGRCVRLR